MLKLLITITNISYLTGVFWLMLCEFMHDFYFDIDLKINSDGNQPEQELDLFIIHYGMEDKTHKESLLIATYFAFTSLSTVGFGDYHPRGDVERIFCAFLLLFGVAIFSYILSIFKDII
jgi:hypothetical protein